MVALLCGGVKEKGTETGIYPKVTVTGDLRVVFLVKMDKDKLPGARIPWRDNTYWLVNALSSHLKPARAARGVVKDH